VHNCSYGVDLGVSLDLPIPGAWSSSPLIRLRQGKAILRGRTEPLRGSNNLFCASQSHCIPQFVWSPGDRAKFLQSGAALSATIDDRYTERYLDTHPISDGKSCAIKISVMIIAIIYSLSSILGKIPLVERHQFIIS